ncbi:MAG: hypothetical protein KDD45_05300 [Bdellovibrionales bacterium]|nr:hypothetical protein [Bdellovibrionales bacterium]
MSFEKTGGHFGRLVRIIIYMFLKSFIICLFLLIINSQSFSEETFKKVQLDHYAEFEIPSILELDSSATNKDAFSLINPNKWTIMINVEKSKISTENFKNPESILIDSAQNYASSLTLLGKTCSSIEGEWIYPLIYKSNTIK